MDLKEYLDGNNSVCREERQFAVFLYHNLLEQRQIVIGSKEKREEYTIEQVYYEASFMRDYFYALGETKELSEEKKADFNQKLVKFVNEKCGKIEKVEFKNRELFSQHINNWNKHIKECEECKKYYHPLAQFMMNATPDLAVLVSKKAEEEVEYYLHFIECKYTSGEDTYKKQTEEGIYSKKQTEVQNLILEFLCGEMNMQYEKKKINAGNTYLCCFEGKWRKWRNRNVISLDDLCNEKKIWMKCEDKGAYYLVKEEEVETKNVKN